MKVSECGNETEYIKELETYRAFMKK